MAPQCRRRLAGWLAHPLIREDGWHIHPVYETNQATRHYRQPCVYQTQNQPMLTISSNACPFCFVQGVRQPLSRISDTGGGGGGPSY